MVTGPCLVGRLNEWRNCAREYRTVRRPTKYWLILLPEFPWRIATCLAPPRCAVTMYLYSWSDRTGAKLLLHEWNHPEFKIIFYSLFLLNISIEKEKLLRMESQVLFSKFWVWRKVSDVLKLMMFSLARKFENFFEGESN